MWYDGFDPGYPDRPLRFRSLVFVGCLTGFALAILLVAMGVI